MVAVSAYMGGTRGSCVLSRVGDVLEMSMVKGVGGVCDIVRRCAISRKYIYVCYWDMCSVVNVCLDHSVLCVLMVEGMYVVVNVMFSLVSVMSPLPALCNLSLRTVVKLCTLRVLTLGVSLVS